MGIVSVVFGNNSVQREMSSVALEYRRDKRNMIIAMTIFIEVVEG